MALSPFSLSLSTLWCPLAVLVPSPPSLVAGPPRTPFFSRNRGTLYPLLSSITVLQEGINTQSARSSRSFLAFLIGLFSIPVWSWDTVSKHIQSSRFFSSVVFCSFFRVRPVLLRAGGRLVRRSIVLAFAFFDKWDIRYPGLPSADVGIFETPPRYNVIRGKQTVRRVK